MQSGRKVWRAYNGISGFPLWGKLSPQVTDEGATTGHFPLIRRVPRHLLPKGEGFTQWLPPLGEAVTEGD